jgi:hypothetical protein
MKFVNPNHLSTIGNGIYVNTSHISNAGYGLFSSKSFFRGDFITLYDGINLSRNEAWTTKVKTHMCTREGVYVDGIKTPITGRGGGSFCNTTSLKRDANAQIVGNLGFILIRCLKPIKEDEEILVFYKQPYLKDFKPSL